MKSLSSGVAKRLILSLGMLAALGGCVVAPYNPGYYGPPAGYYEQPAYAAPAYVVPSVNFGFGYRSGGYYGHHWR